MRDMAARYFGSALGANELRGLGVGLTHGVCVAAAQGDRVTDREDLGVLIERPERGVGVTAERGVLVCEGGVQIEGHCGAVGLTERSTWRVRSYVTDRD